VTFAERAVFDCNVYFQARIDKTVILLPCGGAKRRQSADIARAIAYLKDYESRST